MNIKRRKNLISAIIIAVILAAVLAFSGGCRSGNEPATQEIIEQGNTAEEIRDTEPEKEAATEEDIQSSGQEEAEETTEAVEAEMMEAEEEVEIPDEITAEIEEADICFDDGLYAEAVKEYRDAQRAIENSELAEDIKEELLAGIEENYQEASSITEIARNHHSNAMTLIYEKRFEEAKSELEAALAIYPEYQTAIDALDSLEALMGLK